MRATVIFLTSLFSASLATSSSSTSSSSSSVPAQQSAEPKKIPDPVKSEGCDLVYPKTLAEPGGTSTRIKLGERYFRLTLPVNYATGKPAPLIVAFHDFESSARKLEKASLLSHPNYNKDAIVAYPEAAVESRWMSDPDKPDDIDDIFFTSALIDRLASKLCVDLDRVFVAGQGTGGGLAHLLACSPATSGKIAAFALINANILVGQKTHLGPHDVKDPKLMLWDKCKPARSGPMRLMSVHSENNTVYDYWAEEKFKDHQRIGAVRWLVDWAHENKCGMALEMPVRWRGKWDKVYKTRLHQGYIFEGFVENGTVTKATYHCWYGDTGEQFIPDLFPEEEEAQLPEEEVKQPKEKEAKQPKEEVKQPKEESTASSKQKTGKSTKTESSEKSEETVSVPIHRQSSPSLLDDEEDIIEFTRKLRDSVILEHYFLRNFGHGWPRVKRSSVEETRDKEVESAPPSSYTWENMTEPPEEALNLSFHDPTAFTFHYGFEEPDPKHVSFDTTARVLDFFRMFRLSDPPPKAPRNKDGLTEVEQDVLKQLVADIEKKMAEDEAEGTSVVDEDAPEEDAGDKDANVGAEKDEL